MKTVFFIKDDLIYAVQVSAPLNSNEKEKLTWLLGAEPSAEDNFKGPFVGPRTEMVSPWSTNATEIARNVGLSQVIRIEEYRRIREDLQSFDKMLEAKYNTLSATIFESSRQPRPDVLVEDIAHFNDLMGLALSPEEISFLETGARELGRRLTDSEIFAFGQINSEHCRHKIFNGEFIIDGEPQLKSLFAWIKETSKHAPDEIVSAYTDNVAFIKGATISRFAPRRADCPALFSAEERDVVVSLKAETHNFPTTVEPFYGASTGSGGEIRDRMAGGRGGIPLIGIAVYMTAYPRLPGATIAKPWERTLPPRSWKHQSPSEILVKASNGASDFGNKFGQPLIVGSLLTYEQPTSRAVYSYDRCVMLAGGVGYADEIDAQKQLPTSGDLVVLLGGDNYRIGMAGGSVSSVDGGKFSEELELSAVQRANPEMQKRVCNTIRALTELENNPIKSIHDHGAGGHINCFSELLGDTGGAIDIDALPIGDASLSNLEILCNESQERMGLIISNQDQQLVKAIAERERAPMYIVGYVDSSKQIRFSRKDGTTPFNLPTKTLFGSSPRTQLSDRTISLKEEPAHFAISSATEFSDTLKQVLSLEAVASKDWLTNKVDRSVNGRVALQQCAGPLQLPINDCGVVALDFTGKKGVATAIGHAPAVGLIDETAGASLSVTEALTNLVWAPLAKDLAGVALSANWMWPAKRAGENARLYRAVRALSEFCQELQIPVPTGKDSLSMTVTYDDGLEVRSPGTVVVTAVAVTDDVNKCVTAAAQPIANSDLLYIDWSDVTGYPLGGSSVLQIRGELINDTPSPRSAKYLAACFDAVQQLVKQQLLLAGHDVSAGGIITTLCEMAFAGEVGLKLDLTDLRLTDAAALFCEKPGVIIQVEPEKLKDVLAILASRHVRSIHLGKIAPNSKSLQLDGTPFPITLDREELLRIWSEPSALLDAQYTKPRQAKERFANLTTRRLDYKFPEQFTGQCKDYGIELTRKSETGLTAAIVREKGTNGDRELAFALFAAGFDVRDVTMSDLTSGREDLREVRFLAFPGGFSNSDVLGSAWGWAGAFKYNDLAYRAIRNFFDRDNTLSIGVCNGCQLLVALNLIYPEHPQPPAMLHNESGRFESCFTQVTVLPSPSILLSSLVGSTLGIWVAHGEGRFRLPAQESKYRIPIKFAKSLFPINPNGSDYNAAAICSEDGRHLAIMPHLERSLFPWNWPHKIPQQVSNHQVSPWFLAFTAARDWLRENT